MQNPLNVWITTNYGKFLKIWGYQTTLSASWQICMQVKRQQLEPGMEKCAGSKLGKEYNKAVYCYLAYLTYMQSEVKVSQSCSALCNAMDYTVHRILQARILEWIAFPFSRASSQPRDWTQVSCIAGIFFSSWATRGAHMQSTSCKMLDWMKHKLESRQLGEISITSDMQMSSPNGRKQRETKEALDEGDWGEWKKA